jgi:hypothetical protein
MPDSRSTIASSPTIERVQAARRSELRRNGWCLAACAAVTLAACSGNGSGDDDSSAGKGGSGAQGGSATAGLGGTSPNTGGSGATGGTTGKGGATGTGGSTAGGTGGKASAGNGGRGQAGAGAGGATTGGTGGSVSNGGMVAAGGSGAGSSNGGLGAGGGSGGHPSAGSAGQVGMAGASGSSGSAGSSGGVSICKFASGLNVAWVNFANDVPNPDLNTFKTIFKNTHDAGGRVVRWWFHTNGSVTPGYDSSGLAQKLPQSHIDGVKAILGAAHDAGVVIDLSLWSFDMLQSNAGDAHTNNQTLLENDTNRQAYIDNYLTPLVNAIKGTPGLYSWEIFNEPEGMAPSGWATYRTTVAAIQKTVNWFAAAIHSADPKALVTNGSQTFDYCSGVSGKTNYYSDSALIQAGGKQNGTLDFYEVHYYSQNGASDSCFTYPASHWNLDKKLVMGEFAAADTDNIAQNDLYTKIYSNGYDGAWAWSYDADYKWPAMQAGMQALLSAQPDVGNCP